MKALPRQSLHKALDRAADEHSSHSYHNLATVALTEIYRDPRNKGKQLALSNISVLLHTNSEERRAEYTWVLTTVAIGIDGNPGKNCSIFLGLT